MQKHFSVIRNSSFHVYDPEVLSTFTAYSYQRGKSVNVNEALKTSPIHISNRHYFSITHVLRFSVSVCVNSSKRSYSVISTTEVPSAIDDRSGVHRRHGAAVHRAASVGSAVGAGALPVPAEIAVDLLGDDPSVHFLKLVLCEALLPDVLCGSTVTWLPEKLQPRQLLDL